MDRKDYKYIYNSLNKNGSDRNFNYPIYIRNKEVATQEWVSKTIEGGLEGLEGNYLTIAKAAEIYLSKVDAQNTYLTQVNAQNTYLSKNDANTTYLTNERAQSTYQRKGNYVILNSSNQIDSTYLPSYVDDVLEFDSRSNFPSSGESGKIYVATDTNLTYRWGGSEYVEISKSLALGETSSTAYPGDKGKENRTRIEQLESSKANKSDIPTKTSQLTNDSGYITSYTDTKNTAGSTDTSSKIFLIGATSQSTNPQTYSHDTAYVGTDGCLYSNNTKVSVEGHTHSQYLTSQDTYTKEEINTKLNGKSNVGHTHSQYLTANDIANKADKGTKLSDYGITDAYTKQDADLRFVPGISGDENNDLRGLIYNTGSTVGMEYIASNQNKEFGSIHMEDATGSDPFYIELKTANNHYDLAKQESELIVASDQAGIRCSNNENNQYSTVGAGLFDPNDENNTHNNSCAYLSATDGEISKFLTVTPTSATINNEEIATQTWVQNQLGGFTVDAYTKQEVDNKLNLKANLDGGNTFNGLQTINAPTNTSGSEQTTVKIKTANGGAIVLGKEGQNSGTMIRLDQKDGTCRLRFRSSATAGAMVWEQPEQGAKLYIDLGKDGADKHRIQFPSSAGTLALKSQIPPVNNGTLTIQKNGTNVQTFTANQSGNVTANITVPTKTSELTNDSGYLTSHQSLENYATKNDLANYLPLSGGTLTGNLSGKYITGTWLQTTAASDLGSAPPKYGVISSGGWLYTRTLDETKTDLGIPTKVSQLTNDSGYTNSYNDLTNKPTALPNPYSLIIGGKVYDGSSSKTITAEDLGLTSSGGGITSIYVIDLTSGTVLALDGGQVNVNGYVLTMVYSGMNAQDQTMTISLNQGATEALVAVVNNDTDEIMVESGYGSVYDFVPNTVLEWQNYHVEVFDCPDYNALQQIGTFDNIGIFRSNFTQVCSIKLNEAGTQWIIY